MKLKNKRLLSFVLSLVLIVAMLPMTVSAATAGDTLYLKPSDEWKIDDARFAAYFFGEGSTWVDCADSNGDGIYEVTIPGGAYTNVIFCRMNPGTTENNWNEGVKWNQTADLVIPSDNNVMFTVSGWAAGAWGALGEEVVIEENYYVRGGMNEWGTTDKMEKTGDNTYELTMKIAAGNYEFKIADEGWSKQWQGDNGANLTLTLEADSYVKFTFNSSDCTGSYTITPVSTSDAIKYQMTKNTTAESESTNVRLLTFVDDVKNYKNVTINVTINGKEVADKVITTAYTSIIANDVTINDPASVFDNESAAYFVTLTLDNVGSSLFDEVIVVTVTWEPVEGETVTETRTIVLAEAL